MENKTEELKDEAVGKRTCLPLSISVESVPNYRKNTAAHGELHA